MLQIDQAVKLYDKNTVALNEVSVDFHPGEIVGLLGENGAGKTTLMKSVFGFVQLKEGTILLDDEKIGENNLERLSFATSEHSFFGEFTAQQHKSFYQVTFSKFREKRYDSLMEFFKLPHHTKLRKFSTGQKNQFEVILALSQGATYIFMDEPFAGNDIFNREDFYKVLVGILEETECLILSTHLIEEVKSFLSRVVLLHNGKLIGDISTMELEEQGIDLMDYLRERYEYRKERVMEALIQNQVLGE